MREESLQVCCVPSRGILRFAQNDSHLTLSPRRSVFPYLFMSISPARTIAFKVLLRVATQDAYADESLRAELDETVGPADAGLATEITLGVLRWQRLLDFLIDRSLTNRVKTLDIEVRIALRMGVYQIHFLERVPAHAAVHESVELVKKARKRSAAPLVNAVLRKAAAEPNPPAATGRAFRLASSKGSFPGRIAGDSAFASHMAGRALAAHVWRRAHACASRCEQSRSFPLRVRSRSPTSRRGDGVARETGMRRKTRPPAARRLDLAGRKSSRQRSRATRLDCDSGRSLAGRGASALRRSRKQGPRSLRCPGREDTAALV